MVTPGAIPRSRAERVLIGVGIFFGLLLGVPMILLMTGVIQGTPASANIAAEPANIERAIPAPVIRPAAAAEDAGAAESARAAVAKMVSLGLIKRMDVKTGKFYIDGPLWVGFELDQKQGIVKVISGYRAAEYKGLPQVTLYESKSGKELANYGPFAGVTIK